jgi:biotin-(acetyl-CoA carboxylase) ligase
VGWAPPGAARLGDGIDPLDVLAVMLAAYDELPDDVFERYRSRLVTLGQDVRVELPAGAIEGRATDVERDGRLVVVDRAGVGHRLDTGDVVHLRPLG